MAKRDTRKIYKYSLDTHCWFLDKMPSKRTKRAKAKDRQNAKKEIHLELLKRST